MQSFMTQPAPALQPTNFSKQNLDLKNADVSSKTKSKHGIKQQEPKQSWVWMLIIKSINNIEASINWWYFLLV